MRVLLLLTRQHSEVRELCFAQFGLVIAYIASGRGGRKAARCRAATAPLSENKIVYWGS